MNEAETRAELIDPALKTAGWGVVDASRIRREVIAPGRLQGAGKRSKSDIADYVLIYKNQKLAVIEAKRRDLPDTEGLAQAKRYAERLQARFAFSTNGVGIYRADMRAGAEGHVDAFPSPDALWNDTFAERNIWRERFGAVSFEDKGGFWEARYYQHNAINQVLEAIAAGRDRILLTLATGTGKTAIAFQIAWKLFHARWSLAARNAPDSQAAGNASDAAGNASDADGNASDADENTSDADENASDSQAAGNASDAEAAAPGRRPRILFLADRNILANQAFNDFSAFPDDALVRIDPAIIRKKGRVPKNGSIFFTIFQTFMTGRDANGEPAPSFGDYPPDFFDFIVIDECHRGGANDESNWRGILDYFSPAVQLGLTATPKRAGNVDTYAYFGEPVYVYSLKEGINDGYLTPFKVCQFATTLDDYIYTPDDEVIDGEIDPDRRYAEEDFNRVIEIRERERYRVRLFMDRIAPRDKTIVFCATQAHALAVRDLINQIKTVADPNYCVRVTANDGKEGESFLLIFRDNEKTIPTILTTSQKLSTGVDARNVRNIALMRPIRSMIEFKQIIGRGTRLFDGKDYFTIYDFVKAYLHFSDPEWDGEPLPPDPCPRCGQIPCGCAPGDPGVDDPPKTCPVCGELPCVCEMEPPEPCPECGRRPCVCRKRRKVRVKLADGKERLIQHIAATTFWSPEGKPISAAQFIERMYGDLPALFKNEDELRALWGRPDTRKALLEGLSEKGYGTDQLAEIARLIEAENSDLYDVLAYIAFALAPISRSERVKTREEGILERYDYPQKAFVAFVLGHYIEGGVRELDMEKLPDLIRLRYHSIGDAVSELGRPEDIREVFVGFQRDLY